jgi:hypothetical protein
MSPSTSEEWKTTIAEVAGALDTAKPTIAIPVNKLTASSLAKTIDHTLLKTDATEDQITELCKEAIQYDFAVNAISLHHALITLIMICRPSVCASILLHMVSDS